MQPSHPNTTGMAIVALNSTLSYGGVTIGFDGTGALTTLVINGTQVAGPFNAMGRCVGRGLTQVSVVLPCCLDCGALCVVISLVPGCVRIVGMSMPLCTEFPGSCHPILLVPTVCVRVCMSLFQLRVPDLQLDRFGAVVSPGGVRLRWVDPVPQYKTALNRAPLPLSPSAHVFLCISQPHVLLVG